MTIEFYDKLISLNNIVWIGAISGMPEPNSMGVYDCGFEIRFVGSNEEIIYCPDIMPVEEHHMAKAKYLHFRANYDRLKNAFKNYTK